MNRTRKLFVSTMIAAAGAVTALALSATASAEPVPPAPIPPNPGAQLLSQLSTVGAAAPQLMQASRRRCPAPPPPAAAPATPPPGATASLTLPQAPALPPLRPLRLRCRSCCRPGGRSGQRDFDTGVGASRAELARARGLASLLPAGAVLAGPRASRGRTRCRSRRTPRRGCTHRTARRRASRCGTRARHAAVPGLPTASVLSALP